MSSTRSYRSVIITGLSAFCLLAAGVGCRQPTYLRNTPSTIAVEVKGGAERPANKRHFVTFRNSLHEDNWIGHRIFEHTPMVYGEAPSTLEQAGIDPKATGRLEKHFAERPGVTVVRYKVDQDEWVRSDWIYYFAPAQDGIDVLLVIQTLDEGMPQYYGIQQCLRMGGKTNREWRQEIATTPAFSEYDLWNGVEKDKEDKTSLSYILEEGQWQALPATPQTVGARTPYGACIDHERTGGQPPTEVGPYKAKMLATMDNGLVARRNLEGTWVCGMCWEGTSHISNHHPADCLHAVVNIGPIPPQAKRAVRGKIYYFPGSLDDLTKKHRIDFPDASAR